MKCLAVMKIPADKRTGLQKGNRKNNENMEENQNEEEMQILH